MTKVFTGKLLNSVPKRKELLIPLPDEYLDKSMCIRVGMFKFYMIKPAERAASMYNVMLPKMKIIGLRAQWMLMYQHVDEVTLIVNSNVTCKV